VILEDRDWTIIEGNAVTEMRKLPERSVQCCVTSPPYWGLRAYGTDPQVWGGDGECKHRWGTLERHPLANSLAGPNGKKWLNAPAAKRSKETGPFCQKCGAWKGELGSEPNPYLFIENMVSVFREVRRVLKDDGVLWLNLGDCYASPGMAYEGDGKRANDSVKHSARHTDHYEQQPNRGRFQGFKRKELIGMPWRVALALHDDGCLLRCDVIWQKLRALPESVRDRPSREHEYIFMLTKGPKYYYDQDAVRTELTRKTFTTFGTKRTTGAGEDAGRDVKSRNIRGENRWPRLGADGHPIGANLRSVWSIAPEKYRDGHYAIYPRKLVLPCVLSSTRPGDVVLDPFSGCATTGRVALETLRRFIGIELLPKHAESARRVLGDVEPVQMPLISDDSYQK
jgi:DNA modification methylase